MQNYSKVTNKYRPKFKDIVGKSNLAEMYLWKNTDDEDPLYTPASKF